METLPLDLGIFDLDVETIEEVPRAQPGTRTIRLSDTTVSRVELPGELVGAGR